MTLGARVPTQPSTGPFAQIATFPAGFPGAADAGPGTPAAPVFDPYRFASSVAADAAGVAEITMAPVGFLVLITRIAVNNDGAASSALIVYLGGVDPKNIVDRTSEGNGDIADEVNPIRVPPNTPVLFRWTGCTVGSTSAVGADYWQQRP